MLYYYNTAKSFKFTSKSDPDVPACSWCASVALLTLPLFPAHLTSALTTEPRFDWPVELHTIPCALVAALLPSPCQLVVASKGTCAKSYPPAAVCPSWPLSCSETAQAILKLFSLGASDEDTIPCRSVCGSNELFDGIVFLPSACPSAMCMAGFLDCAWEAVETIFWVVPDWERMPSWVMIDTSVECIRMSQLVGRWEFLRHKIYSILINSY